MKRLIIAIPALSLTLAGAALALSDSAAKIDTNADGELSLQEVQAAYPDVTGENFATMDLNADGALDDEEVAAAEEAGMMPTKPQG